MRTKNRRSRHEAGLRSGFQCCLRVQRTSVRRVTGERRRLDGVKNRPSASPPPYIKDDGMGNGTLTRNVCDFFFDAGLHSLRDQRRQERVARVDALALWEGRVCCRSSWSISIPPCWLWPPICFRRSRRRELPDRTASAFHRV